MSAFTLVRHTPIWVWVLFLFLIKRGISALSDRQMSLRRLFLLPLLFLVWGIWSLRQEFHLSAASMSGMAAGLLIGTAVGWMLWRNQPRLQNAADKHQIIRPGTPLTLILIVIAFSVKYGLTAWLLMHPQLHQSATYSLQFGVITGVLDGLFWGGTLNLFLAWRREAVTRR